MGTKSQGECIDYDMQKGKLQWDDAMKREIWWSGIQGNYLSKP